MGVSVKVFRCGPIDTNCYVVYDENKSAVLVDLEENYDELQSFIDENGLTVQMILVTHPHFDHLRGIDSMRKSTGAKVAVAKQCVDYTEDGEAYLEHKSVYANSGRIVPDIIFEDGDVLHWDDNLIEVYVGNGHSKADSVFKIENNLFTGDALFRGTIGRTDLENGDYGSLVKFVKGLKRFDDDVNVYPGHGGFTTIGAESHTNKYMMGE